MFGVFSWKVMTNDDPSPTVSVLISGLGNNATLGHFTLPSSGGESSFFAGHIIDFRVKGSDATSHWVAGSTDPSLPPPPGGLGGPPPAPEPSTLAMGAIALGGLVSLRLVRRRSTCRE
jgi:MYXO-CTERM domain-containing protein